MTWADMLPLLTQTGVFGLLTLVAYRLHVDAINAHKARADDWRDAYKLKAAEASERESQLAHVLEAVTRKAAPA